MAWGGEIRATSPLSPTIAVGADRFQAISTHCAGRVADHGTRRTDDPPPEQVAGTVMNSAFLHHLSSDARRLGRINHLVGRDEARGSGDDGEYRRVGLLVVTPSRDLEQLAGKHELRLPWALRHLLWGVGVHDTPGPGLLSLLSFQPEYLRTLMELGEEDAEARREEVEAFLDGNGPDA